MKARLPIIGSAARGTLLNMIGPVLSRANHRRDRHHHQCHLSMGRIINYLLVYTLAKLLLILFISNYFICCYLIIPTKWILFSLMRLFYAVLCKPHYNWDVEVCMTWHCNQHFSIFRIHSRFTSGLANTTHCFIYGKTKGGVGGRGGRARERQMLGESK